MLTAVSVNTIGLQSETSAPATNALIESAVTEERFDLPTKSQAVFGQLLVGSAPAQVIQTGEVQLSTSPAEDTQLQTSAQIVEQNRATAQPIESKIDADVHETLSAEKWLEQMLGQQQTQIQARDNAAQPVTSVNVQAESNTETAIATAAYVAQKFSNSLSQNKLNEPKPADSFVASTTDSLSTLVNLESLSKSIEENQSLAVEDKITNKVIDFSETESQQTASGFVADSAPLIVTQTAEVLSGVSLTANRFSLSIDRAIRATNVNLAQESSLTENSQETLIQLNSQSLDSFQPQVKPGLPKLAENSTSENAPLTTTRVKPLDVGAGTEAGAPANKTVDAASGNDLQNVSVKQVVNQSSSAFVNTLGASSSASFTIAGNTDTGINSSASVTNETSIESPRFETLLKMPTQEAKWGEQLLHALRDRVYLQLQERVQSTTIRLDPPELGSLEIFLSHESGRLTVQISASQADVARMLQTTSDRLRQDLAGPQFTDVNVQTSSDNQAGQQRSRQESRSPFTEEPVLAAAQNTSGKKSTKAEGNGNLLASV